MDNLNENSVKIEKRLKRTEFNLYDSALATCMFIVLQVLFTFFYQSLPSSVLGSFTVAFLISFLVEAVFFFAVLITAVYRKVEFVKATKMNVKPDILSVLLAVGISITCLLAFTNLTNVFVNFLYKLGYSSNASLTVPNLFVYLIYVFLVCICPAFFEDLLFRGTILNGLRKLGDNKAVILSALIFMLMHGGPDQTIHQFIIGIVLGYSFLASGTIWIPVIIHFVNNFVALTLAYITRGVEVTEVVVPTWGVLFVQLVSAVIMAVIGVYIVYFSINGLKKLREIKEREIAQKAVETKTEQETEVQENTETETMETTEEITNPTEENIEEQDKKEIKNAKLCFILAGAYLVLDWILALIGGLL